MWRGLEALYYRVVGVMFLGGAALVAASIPLNSYAVLWVGAGSVILAVVLLVYQFLLLFDFRPVNILMTTTDLGVFCAVVMIAVLSSPLCVAFRSDWMLCIPVLVYLAASSLPRFAPGRVRSFRVWGSAFVPWVSRLLVYGAAFLAYRAYALSSLVLRSQPPLPRFVVIVLKLAG